MTDAEYRQHYAALVRALRGRFPRTDPDLIHDAVTDALVDHWRRPWRQDPARLSLDRYPRMAAIRNLLNLLRRSMPALSIAVPLRSLTGWDPSAVPQRQAVSAEEVALARIASQDLTTWILSQVRDRDELLVAQRWLAGEWASKSAGVDAALARARDRLTRRLRRAAYRHRGP